MELARTLPIQDEPDPTAAGLIYEPKWDGFRCIVFRDGDSLELQSRNKRPLGRYFPELVEPLCAALPDRCVVDGEIVVADVAGRGLDFDALLQRIHPAASRVDRLAGETPAAFVAFDLLALGDEVLFDTAFARRRALLVERVAPNDTVLITPATTDPAVAADWFSRFEGAGLDGVVAKRGSGVYEPGKRALVKVKHERTADCAVAGYRIHKDGRGVGSLLLGLYDGDGELRSVGVAAAFSATRRTELLTELEPRSHDVGDHPWAQWAGDPASETDRHAATGGSRWSAGKDLSFVPIRMGLVAEVTFGQLEGRRFRHGVKFIRWRPDRDPASCRFDQLDVADPVDFREFIATST